MIFEVEGNLLRNLTNHQAIAHGANTRGRMNAGFAKDLADQVDGLLKDFQRHCREETPQGGDIHIYDRKTPIYNLFTQENLREAKPGFLNESIHNMYMHAQENGITDIAMPLIGTGYGNLSEEDFYNSLQPFIHDSEHHVTVYRLMPPTSPHSHLRSVQ